MSLPCRAAFGSILLVSSALALWGCSGSSSNGASGGDSSTGDDGASEAGPEPGTDATADGEVDASMPDATHPVDAHVEAAVDAHVEAAVDAAMDAPHEASAHDAGHDAASSADAGLEAGAVEAGADGAVADAGLEAGGGDGGDSGSNLSDAGALPTALAIWNFDDALGAATAVDSSGNGHTATLAGTASIVAGGVGASGNALSIDGSLGAFAQAAGGFFDDSQSFTISAWAQFPTFDGNYHVLMGGDGAHASVFFLQIAPASSTQYDLEVAFPSADVAQPSTYFYAYSSAPPVVSHWYHLVGVWDASAHQVSLYVDGAVQSNALSSPSTGSVSPIVATGSFVIGAGKWNDARTPGPAATYDAVRLYATALSASQVTALYTTPE